MATIRVGSSQIVAIKTIKKSTRTFGSMCSFMLSGLFWFILLIVTEKVLKLIGGFLIWPSQEVAVDIPCR